MSAFQSNDLYPALASVHQEWKTVREEARAALAHLTYIRDNRVSHPTAWGVLPLLPEAEDLHLIPEDVRESCRQLAPRTIGLMSAIPGVHAYAFSVVAPHHKIGAHRHHNPYVTALLTLQGESAYIVVDGQRASCTEGELLIFDYTLRHATVNDGEVERIALLMLLDNCARL